MRAEGVEYVIGLARNPRLQGRIAGAKRRSRSRAAVSGEPAKRFRSFRYRTRNSRPRSRRVIAKAEALPGKGGRTKANHRFIVTSLPASTHPVQTLCEKFCCARGDAENWVREVKTGLFAGRCPPSLFGASTLRLCIPAFAHILHHRLARALAGGKADKAPFGRKLDRTMPQSLRLRLLKIGASVSVPVRRIRAAMSRAPRTRTSSLPPGGNSCRPEPPEPTKKRTRRRGRPAVGGGPDLRIRPIHAAENTSGRRKTAPLPLQAASAGAASPKTAEKRGFRGQVCQV